MSETIPEEYIAKRVAVLHATVEKRLEGKRGVTVERLTKGEAIVYYEDVPFFMNTVLHAFGVLYDGTLTFYPISRLYSLTLAGAAMDKFIAHAKLATTTVEEQLAAVRAVRAAKGGDAR